MRELERAVGEALEVEPRRIDRHGRDVRLLGEHVDAVELDRDPLGGQQRRAVAPLDRQPVEPRVAAQLEPALAGSLLTNTIARRVVRLPLARSKRGLRGR